MKNTTNSHRERGNRSDLVRLPVGESSLMIPLAADDAAALSSSFTRSFPPPSPVKFRGAAITGCSQEKKKSSS